MNTASAQGTEVRTFIWGSCVSRDTFGYLPDAFRLHRYVARQSLISAGDDASRIRAKLRPLSSAFQQRMVVGDLEGNLYAALDASASDVDLVLVDLVDERGGVIDFSPGHATKLNEFWGAGGREASRGSRHVPFGTDEHYELWEKGTRRFVSRLHQLGLFRRTVVLRAPWASSYADGEAMELPDWMMRPAEADRLYERYFGRLEQLGLRIVELPADLARSTRDHQWGASPFHYQHAAYEFFAREIGAAIDDAGVVRGTSTPQSRRDTSAWGTAVEVDSPAAIAHSDLPNGLLTVWQDNTPIDLLIEDNGAATTLVSFHAALGKSGLLPPVFTGRTISQNIGVNRIFVSDPGLLRDGDLAVAWYLGTNDLDLTEVLAEIVGALQKRFGGQHLVFFGMSGGGFAALNLSHEFPGSLAVPVNPQSRILDYAEVHWDALGRSCFGSTSTEQSRQLLEAHPRADLRKVYAGGFSNAVIYVQNSTDSHTSAQLIPWFDAIGWQGDVSILFGRWGKGHVPPPAAELKKLLSALASADGDWAAVARTWQARTDPDREYVRTTTGR